MIRWYIFIFLVPVIMSGQTVRRSLQKANSLFFRDHIYVYGFWQEKNSLQFKLYKTDAELSKIDSVITEIGKEKVEEYLEITGDTLHGYLNFYFQKANSDKSFASLLRYNPDLKLITRVDKFESSRINSLTTFENEVYTYKNAVYTIRISEDSLGKQFFLNKHEFISDQKPFEYKITWQYPLEKRNINTAHVFYADSELVLMYVTIISGEKKGQWILKLNSANGSVIKGLKLNPKDDERSYIFNSYLYDRESGEILIAGNIYTKQQFDPEARTFSFINQNKQNTFFIVKINTDEIMERVEKTVPITYTANPAPKAAGAKPQACFYHVRIKELKKTSAAELTAYCDLYKTYGSQLLFLYETGFNLTIIMDEMAPEMPPTAVRTGRIMNNLALIPNLVNTDPKDINGKIELKSISGFDHFLYMKPISDVEKQFGTDDNKNPKWIISKNDIKTGKVSYYKVYLGQKGIESKLLLERSKYDNPNIYKIKNDQLVIFDFNSESAAFTLSYAVW